jgi:hypothetical protein
MEMGVAQDAEIGRKTLALDNPQHTAGTFIAPDN